MYTININIFKQPISSHNNHCRRVIESTRNSNSILIIQTYITEYLRDSPSHSRGRPGGKCPALHWAGSGGHRPGHHSCRSGSQTPPPPLHSRYQAQYGIMLILSPISVYLKKSVLTSMQLSKTIIKSKDGKENKNDS